MLHTNMWMDLRCWNDNINGITKTGHTTDISSDGEHCTCTGFIFRKDCKHIKELKNMEVDDLRKDEKISGISYIESSLDGLNQIYNGSLYNSDEMVAIYADSGMGKTLFCVQEAYYFASKGLNTMYIDLEGGFLEFMNRWHDTFVGRFGNKTGKIDWQGFKDTRDFMKFMGYEIKIETKGSKQDLVKEKTIPIEDTDIYKLCRKLNIDVIILDSMTDPLREFMSQQQDHPAKADMAGMIMRTFKTLMQMCGVCVITLNHSSINPANPFQTQAFMRGGTTIQYYSKRIIYLDRRDKKGLKDYRRFWIVRSANIPKWSRLVGAEINDLGYFDIDDDTVDKILTDNEKGKVGR